MHRFISVQLLCVSVFMPISYYFDCHNFVIYFENRNCGAIFVLFEDCFGYLRSFVLLYEFQDCFFLYLQQNTIQILLEIALNLLITLGRMVILTMSSNS